MSYTRTWFLDLLERCAKTFVQIFLATLFAGGVVELDQLRDVGAVQAAALAGVGAVLSILFSVLSAWASSSNGTASLVPDVVDRDEYGGGH